MMIETISLLPVIASTVASVIIGSLWYGPVFGKIWIKEMGWTEEEMKKGKEQGMNKAYALTMVGSLLSAFVLGQIIEGTNTIGAWEGAMVGFWAWLGFAVPLFLSNVLWEGKSWKMFQINAGYQLVTWFVMGAILGAWM